MQAFSKRSATASEIPARRGKAVHVERGRDILVINTHGEQVVDTWAFNRDDLDEFMSMEHTRAHTLALVPWVGDILRTNRRRPILTVVEDTSGGAHDTLIAACDRYRYAFLGVEGDHDNCADNLIAGLAELGLTSSHVPCPSNLFMNIPWMQGGETQLRRATQASAGRPGSRNRLFGMSAGYLADQGPSVPAGRGALQDWVNIGKAH